jgi:hypothetical protein
MAENQSTNLAEAWENAFERKNVGPGSIEKATFLGSNICIKIPEIFAAAFDTVKAGGSVFAAIVFPAAWPATVPVAAWESYCAARSLFSALVEKMTPLEYVTVVIVAKHKEGIKETDLAKEVEAFVKEPNTSKFSWHLGMSAERVSEALADSNLPDWIYRTDTGLESKGFVKIDAGIVYPKSKNVEWKFGF